MSIGALVILLLSVSVLSAAGPERVRVEVLFRESGTRESDGAAASGGLVVTERGLSRGSLGLEATSRTTRTRRSSGVFTLVQDGGESRLAMATRVPVHEVSWWRDYATGAGYVAGSVTFQDVGTSLLVRARVLDDDRIRVELVPSVSWFSADGSGAIDFTESATTVEVRPGEEVVIGGGTRELDDVTRRILGVGRVQETSESTIVLRATVE